MNTITPKTPANKKPWWQWSSGLTQKDILLITKRIGDMTGHGFSVVDSLRTLELQAENQTLKEVATTLRSQVEMGNTLADSMTMYPRYFSNVYVNLVRVGEKSGTLSKSLHDLLDHQTQQYELKRNVLSALTYPAIILSLMVVIAIGMILFLIPFLKDMFASFSAELPLPTRILLKSEHILKTYWWIILLGLGVLVSSIIFLLRQDKVRLLVDRMILHIPILGPLVRSYQVSQIIKTFATMQLNGIPIRESLQIVTAVPGNRVYRQAMESVVHDVERGSIFSDALSKFPKLFSPLVIESVKLGEKAGNLGDSLNSLAELFQDDVKASLKTLTTLIQPLLLILVGVMVAGFALSIIVPLQRLPSLMQKK